MKDAAPTGGPLFVTVGNRGAQIATAVTVRVWTHAWPLGTNAPPWKAALWNASGTQSAQDIPSGATRQFGGYPLPTAPGRYLVFVQATSADDRANTDPATLYASSFMATPLADLVPSDNNLGLTVVEIP
jgi:hypothetical protein